MDVAKMMLVQHFLENTAKRLPDKTALVCGNQRLSYRDIDRQADLLARTLLSLGVRRGDRVCLLLDNSVESVISIFGILKAGGVFCILSPTMKAKKLAYILKDSGARALITHVNKVRVVKNTPFDAANNLTDVIWCGNPEAGGADSLLAGAGSPRSHSWESMFDTDSHVSNKERRRTIDVDIATIIYTSGSTGEPKGVVSTHQNVTAAASSICQYLENTERDIILNVLPLSFDYGLYQVLMAFLFGGTLILEKSFAYPYRVLERLVEERVTGFPIVPTIAAMLLQMQDLGQFDFRAFRYITNTAAALPVSHIERLQELFPDVKICSMYGLTECKRVSYLPPEDLKAKPESVGIPIPNTEVCIVDEKGKTVGSGEVGELVVRGANVMHGYWNAPEETKRVFRSGDRVGDRWLYTGDMFRMDEEEYLYFVSRKDDLIKTKGERVSPKEIEGVLCDMEGVLEVAVIGVPDEIAGQAIKAFVCFQEGNERPEKEILKHCAIHLEPFMMPKYIEFRQSLPKLANGKIDKKSLS